MAIARLRPYRPTAAGLSNGLMGDPTVWRRGAFPGPVAWRISDLLPSPEDRPDDA